MSWGELGREGEVDRDDERGRKRERKRGEEKGRGRRRENQLQAEMAPGGNSTQFSTHQPTRLARKARGKV